MCERAFVTDFYVPVTVIGAFRIIHSSDLICSSCVKSMSFSVKEASALEILKSQKIKLRLSAWVDTGVKCNVGELIL